MTAGVWGYKAPRDPRQGSREVDDHGPGDICLVGEGGGTCESPGSPGFPGLAVGVPAQPPPTLETQGVLGAPWLSFPPPPPSQPSSSRAGERQEAEGRLTGSRSPLRLREQPNDLAMFLQHVSALPRLWNRRPAVVASARLKGPAGWAL